jgi:hypothetical protein
MLDHGEFHCFKKSTIRGSSRDSRKGTVCSAEASVFCYGHERGRLRKQTVARLDGYPELALLVRTIKYLGIYRQKALLSALASRDRPLAGVLMGDVEKAVSTNQIPAGANNS